MKTPSLAIAVTTAGKHVVLYCGDDAGKAKEQYSANTTNPDYAGMFLLLRPEFTRRARPAESKAREVAAAKAKAEAEAKAKAEAEKSADNDEKPTEQPKRKATK